jgi:hypothetical protein
MDDVIALDCLQGELNSVLLEKVEQFIKGKI